jgi:hypothetical protein
VIEGTRSTTRWHNLAVSASPASGPVGGIAASYASDFYIGCQGCDGGNGLFVSDADLEGVLIPLLYNDLATCRADGGAADAGFVCGSADSGP